MLYFVKLALFYFSTTNFLLQYFEEALPPYKAGYLHLV